jgi:diaminopimelate decarboxylase
MNQIASLDIKELANKFGTPFYIYDEARITQNYESLKTAFRSYYPDTSIHFSIKANSNLNILKHFLKLGSRVDTSSPFEVLLARQAGFTDDLIIFTGNYESMEDLGLVANTDIRINLDDFHSFERLKRHGIPERISFRINPGIGRGGFEGITTAGTDAKFGVPYEKAFDAYKAAKEAGSRRFGIHMMTGSNNLEPYYFAEVTEKLLKIMGDIFSRLKIIPDYIDIGGGMGIPYSIEEEPLNVNETARLIADIITEKCQKFGFPLPQLILEPGRYLVANAGFLVARVSGIKNSYKTFIGLDAGMNHLIRQALYGAQHRITVYGKEKLESNVMVCGNICENSDIFSKSIFLPQIAESDLVVFHDAGAYGYSMSSNYNNRPRPAEVMISRDKATLIRRRESFEDFLRLYTE